MERLLKRWGLGVFLALICLWAGCSAPAGPPAPQRATLWEAPYAPGTGERPLRVVSLTPSLTETICDLGGQDLLVGVTDNDDYPPAVRRIPSVGDMYPNLELITAAKPDLVVYDSTLVSAQLQANLRRLKVPHLGLAQQNLDNLRHNLQVLGQALQLGAGAQAAQERFNSYWRRLERGRRLLPQRPRVFLAIWLQPLVSVGRSSYYHQLLELAGAQNCTAAIADPYPVLSLEGVLALRPQGIVLNFEPYPDLSQKRVWSELEAVRAGRVYHIPSSSLQRPTLRCLEGALQLQEYLVRDFGGRPQKG